MAIEALCIGKDNLGEWGAAGELGRHQQMTDLLGCSYRLCKLRANVRVLLTA